MVLCRCCGNVFESNKCKDLFTRYIRLGKEEVYDNMIRECFDISLSISDCNKICEMCIGNLRDSMNFKEQIMQSEINLLKLVKMKGDDSLIKKEEALDDDDNFETSCSDDIVLKDEHIEQKNSNEYDVEVSKIQSQGKSRENSYVSDMCQTDTSSSEECKDEEIKKKIKNTKCRTKNKTKSLVCKKGELGNQTTAKHLHNLHTILNYSNVVPFKNKTILGYICSYCYNPFPDPLDLRCHTEKQHKKERKHLLSKFDIRSLTINLDITDLKCTICQENISDLKALKEHLTNIHCKRFNEGLKDHFLQFKLQSAEKYDCTLCTSTHETFKMLKQHMSVHYNNYACIKCGTPFITWNSLQAHEETHMKGTFPCELCDKVFTTSIKRNKHQKLVHMTKNIQKCPHCEEPFGTYYRRNQHMVKVHNTELLYNCNICNKGFLLKTHLMNHIKKHHLMERDHKCPECALTFFDKKGLNSHMLKHSPDKLYQCEVCSKSYKNKKTLGEHMRIHNNDRRFKCSVCVKAFIQKCSLKSHLLSVHGIVLASGGVKCSF